MVDTKILLCYILTTLALALALSILVLTALLSTWTTASLSTYPMINVSTDTASEPSSILAFPAKYNSYGLVLNIIPGAGGTIDSLLLFVCFFSIDYIYLSRRTWLAKLAKDSARRGAAPTWLWGIAIFIIAFSIARSLVGFIGSMVGYYSSGTFTSLSAGSVQVNSDNAYVAPDGKGFSVGGWTCQVENHIVGEDPYHGTLRSLCAQDQAARWMVLPLLIVFSALLAVVVLRLRGERKRMRKS